MEAKELITPFRDHLIHIFETMLSLIPVAKEPFQGIDENLEVDITGTIGIVGDISGTVSVRFPSELACRVASLFLNENITEINRDVKDAVGELANIVAGGAKGILEERHHIDFKLAIPTVILGHDHVLGYPQGVSVWTVPFSLAESRFYLEICYKEK